MNESSYIQQKNRAYLPQKVRHFFSTFPDSCELPALPDWLLRRPMGSVCCLPSKSCAMSRSERSRKSRNRIEPESDFSIQQTMRPLTPKRNRDRVADLTYKNTWSSFLKSAQSEQATFYPTKSASFPRSNVGFDPSRDHHSADKQAKEKSKYRKSHFSCSPVRRRPVSRKFTKMESKKLREAWLHEDIFPYFGRERSNVTASAKKNNYRPPNRKGDSVKANVSYSTSDAYLTPDSMQVHGTSTDTSNSVQVQATSSSATTYDSMDNRYPCSRRPALLSNSSTRSSKNNSLETTQSVEVQVSSTITNSSGTSMKAHISSGSSEVNDFYSRDREIRRSWLSESKLAANFRESCRLDWTKRYLYMLSPSPRYYYEPSSSLSRYSSIPRDFHVYTVQQRPWQSSPDLRFDKWPKSILGPEDSLNIVNLLQKKKKQLLFDVLRHPSLDEDSIRSLKRQMRSLSMLQSSPPTRSQSANRSRSIESVPMISSPPIKAKKVPDFQKSHDSLSQQLQQRKKDNITTSTRPFNLSMDRLSQSNSALQASSRSEDEKNQSLTSTSASERIVGSSGATSRRSRTPERRPRSGVKKDNTDLLYSFNIPLQPASGENKASALRRSLNRKKVEEQQIHSYQQQEKERERRLRLRALRLDPAWSEVRGGDQALEDIEHRRCYKEVVERERLLQYHIDRDEMLARVWQMPPLFERQRYAKSAALVRHRYDTPPIVEAPSPSDMFPKILKVYSPIRSPRRSKSRSNKKKSSSKNEETRPVSAKEKRGGHILNDCYLASESLQLSRPNTAKGSSKTSKRHLS